MQKTGSDHALAIVKAALEAIPFVGGSIASLVSDYVPSTIERSRERAMGMLSSRLEELKDRVDADTVNKDEFAEVFKSAYLAIVRTQQEERLRVATNLIANVLLKSGDSDKLAYRELDHFSRAADFLSIGALEALAAAAAFAERTVGFPSVSSPSKQFAFGDLRRDLGNPDAELMMGLLGELHALNLIHLLGSPSVQTPNYGNYALRVTPLGRKFVAFLIRPGRPVT